MRLAVLGLAVATLAGAHPMGNFSVNQYTLIRPGPGGVDVTYIFDFAESPTFDLLGEWNVAAGSSSVSVHAAAAMERWVGRLLFRSGGQTLTPRIERTDAITTPGAGGLSTLRITAQLHLAPPYTSLDFADSNFQDRSGWKEIVIDAAPGVAVIEASHLNQDRSRQLTAYPADRRNAPFDLRARLKWRVTAAAGGATAIRPIPQPDRPPNPSPPASAGAARKTDFLSRLLNRRDLTVAMILAGLAVAFGLGAVHAMSPGHGKTLVAAYLVGARGNLAHAFLLGGTVTFTHTISVFLLGFGTLFLSRYIIPNRVIPILGTLSGLAIVAIGVSLVLKRARQAGMHSHAHAHTHSHDHHHHGAHAHHHGEGDVSIAGLIALGASGGLVPCPSALVLLLSSIALGRTGLGLLLLTAFSLGLAVVLIAIGTLVLYAKQWLPSSVRTAHHPAFRFVPVLSAAVIVCLGILITGLSVAQAFSPVFN